MEAGLGALIIVCMMGTFSVPVELEPFPFWQDPPNSQEGFRFDMAVTENIGVDMRSGFLNLLIEIEISTILGVLNVLCL